MAVAKKRGPGRPRKVVDNEKVTPAAPALPKNLSSKHRVQLMRLKRTVEEVLQAYRSLRHPDMGDVIALDDAFLAFKHDLFEEMVKDERAPF